MKTFKLKMLKIVMQEDGKVNHIDIPLKDGLIINREDDHNRWLIEAYIDSKHMSFFNNLYEEKQDVMVEVKITKESNDPAFFITSIIGINEIDPVSINVLMLGTIVDNRKGQTIEEIFTALSHKEA